MGNKSTIPASQILHHQETEEGIDEDVASQVTPLEGSPHALTSDATLPQDGSTAEPLLQLAIPVSSSSSLSYVAEARSFSAASPASPSHLMRTDSPAAAFFYPPDSPAAAFFYPPDSPMSSYATPPASPFFSPLSPPTSSSFAAIPSDPSFSFDPETLHAIFSDDAEQLLAPPAPDGHEGPSEGVEDVLRSLRQGHLLGQRAAAKQSTLQAHHRRQYSLDDQPLMLAVAEDEDASADLSSAAPAFCFWALPLEILVKILGELQVHDLLNLALVSRDCHALCSIPALWKNLAFRFCDGVGLNPLDVFSLTLSDALPLPSIPHYILTHHQRSATDALSNAFPLLLSPAAAAQAQSSSAPSPAKLSARATPPAPALDDYAVIEPVVESPDGFEWRISYCDLIQLSKRRQFHQLVSYLFKDAGLMEYDPVLYRTSTFLHRFLLPVPKSIKVYSRARDVLILMHFFLPPLFPLGRLRPQLRISSFRYLQEERELSQEYLLPAPSLGTINGTYGRYLKWEVMDAIRQFATYYRQSDRLDRLRPKGFRKAYVGRHNSVMRSTPERLLAEAAQLSRAVASRWLSHSYLVQDQPTPLLLHQQFRYLSCPDKQEAIFFCLDLHPENLTPWDLQEPAYKSALWARHARFDILKDAIWHFVLCKTQMNHAHRFGLFVYDTDLRLVLPLTNDLPTIGSTLLALRLDPLQPPPAAFPIEALLTTVTAIVQDTFPPLPSPGASSSTVALSLPPIDSPTLRAALIPTIRPIIFYGRSFQAPLPASSETLAAFHQTCHAALDRCFVSIDVLALQLPPTPTLSESKKAKAKIDESPTDLSLHQEIKTIFSEVILPIRGYYWSDNSTDALSLTAQLAVLLGNATQRTSKQSLDAQFGKKL